MMNLLEDPKVGASIQSALLFMVVANPMTYRLTNMFFFGLVTRNNTGTPSLLGLLLHAVVFGLIAYLLMSKGIPSRGLPMPSWSSVDEVTEAVDVVKGNKMIAKEIMEREKPVENVPLENEFPGLNL
jgi:hypothetical protein